MIDDPIRAKIEALGTQLTLPTVRKALGVIEGEHASRRAGGSDDLMDVRAYEPGDEARLIEWKTSARQGRPMVVHRERLVTSRVWMLLDVGREMTGSCASGERAYEVAANALRMFAALSLRRSDDISLVFCDAASITRVPFNGGFAQFERTLDGALRRRWTHGRNIDAMLDYARRVKDRRALIVLATDEHALTKRHMRAVRLIARTHPIVLIDVATLNPFAAPASMRILDGVGGRRLPAFFASARAAAQVDTHRAYMAAALEHELERVGGHVIRAGSSEDMFDAFIALISHALAGRTRNQLAPAPELALGGSDAPGGAA
ncbi:DUF58 domain-containing protein [Bifidobacterium sp. MA2]|uniref:DUF58 domain-containing protein n=1 Tax=Bifidobacterium santillanense TaxID=2809028 RepID=A0ABS5UNC0_9BIFI|nr:DUF58 domain-containing protein [Bifidobacterium santillanense]MBT1172285.1 DUF58 domain-containing protein [Bifidobacterium santillanense]